MINLVNKDGQTPLDVARVNLMNPKFSEACRETMRILEAGGAQGKATTEADVPRFEANLERHLKEKSVESARKALKAMAVAAHKKQNEGVVREEPSLLDRMGKRAEYFGRAFFGIGAAEEEAERVKTEGKDAPKPIGQVMIAESLSRISSLDESALKEKLAKKLGGKISSDQIEKLSARLKGMSPEELASYSATGKLLSKFTDEPQDQISQKLKDDKVEEAIREKDRAMSVIVD